MPRTILRMAHMCKIDLRHRLGHNSCILPNSAPCGNTAYKAACSFCTALCIERSGRQVARCGELPSQLLHYAQAVVVNFDMDGGCNLADRGTCVRRGHGV
jgi:hypothetical protein